MKTLISTLATLALVPAAYAADMQHSGSMPMDHSSMNHSQMQHEQAAQTASASGTVKKIDLDRGYITIAHGPVESLQWPAMVMPFKASAEQLAQVEIGDEVTFEFLSASGMAARLTSLSKR